MIKRDMANRGQLFALAAILQVVLLAPAQTQAQADEAQAGGAQAPGSQAPAGAAGATQVNAEAAAGTPAAAQAPAGTGEPVPGPLLEARKILFQRIGQAKQEGIGTGAYLAEYQSIEQAVSSGQSEDVIKPRIERLARALRDQLERGKILKTQRPIPPTPSQSTTPPAAAGGPAGLAGGPQAALLEKVKEKLSGGGLGGGLGGGGLPAGAEDFLNSDKGKKLLEKLKN
jgi:hypothetical protein